MVARRSCRRRRVRATVRSSARGSGSRSITPSASTTGQRVDDAFFARLKTRFSEAQIVELTAAIALENFRSKFNPPLGIEAQGFCLLPERQP